MSLIDTAVEEILRWTSTPTHIMRTTRRPLMIRDQFIEVGERVTVWLPSANRDDEIFAHPEQFDIGRIPNRHLSFGQGEHFCLGGALARTELRMLYAAIAGRTSKMELCGEPRFLSSIVVNGPQMLPVRLT